MAARGSDRAVMLIPTWFLLLVWVAGAGFTVMGTFTNDLVSPGLIGGLVLIVMLIGFTVMQNAFSGSGVSNFRGRRRRAPRSGDDGLRRRDLRLERRCRPNPRQRRDRKPARPEARRAGGAGRVWLDIIHPMDRDRYKAALDGCCSSAAAASTTIFACAPPTATISGLS
jgi:hypothetical protein